MPDPSSENEKKAKTGSSSWFGSWFDNDNSKLKNQIHQQLNDMEDQQDQYLKDREQRRKEWLDRYQHFFDGAPQNQNGNESSQASTAAAAAVHPQVSDLHKELQDFFEAAMGGGILGSGNGASPFPEFGNNNNSMSVQQWGYASSYRMHQDSKNGVQIDVQLPKGTPSKDVAVNVLQEYPCQVQWKGSQPPAAAETNTTNSRWGGRRSQQDSTTHPFQEQVRLGESIDCSRLSASLDQARNLLTIKAPVHPQQQQDLSQDQVRSIPVTERDQ